MMADELPDLSRIMVKQEPYSPEPSTSKEKRDFYIVPEICLICGKPTKCYHYDVASCNGCKIFFRRSLILNHRYRCHNHGKCLVDKGSPCRACRLDKCILVGMNPKAIQFPTNVNPDYVILKVEKRRIFLEGKLEAIKCEPKFEQTYYCKEIEYLLYMEKKIKILRDSSYNPTRMYNDIWEILQHPSELGNAEKYEKPKHWPINYDKYRINVKNGQEIIDYLVEHGLLDRHWTIVDNVITVEASKAFPIYQKIDDEEKVLMLEKIGFVNAMLMQRFYSLAHNLETLMFPDGIIPMKICVPSDKIVPKKLSLEVFCRSLEPLHRTNLTLTEFVLLQSIIFCYTAIPKLLDKTRILLTKQRETYALILLRHLQAQYGEEAGAKKYTNVISLVETYFYFAQREKQLMILCAMSSRENCRKKLYESKLFDQILYK